MQVIDAAGMDYKVLNGLVKEAVGKGAASISLENVLGQRYIATGLHGEAAITINGVPGNDTGAFMDGSRITVLGNVQDGCGNTMRSGEIIVHGRAGDIVGLSMQGGRIFIRDEAGYRVGIHMKERGEKRPMIVIGETTQDFAGEYMAGGVILMLNRKGLVDPSRLPRFLGTGMHGGVIYVRGTLQPWQTGTAAGARPADADDLALIEELVTDYGRYFGLDVAGLAADEYTRVAPLSHRPYGKLYAE